MKVHKNKHYHVKFEQEISYGSACTFDDSFLYFYCSPLGNTVHLPESEITKNDQDSIEVIEISDDEDCNNELTSDNISSDI